MAQSLTKERANFSSHKLYNNKQKEQRVMQVTVIGAGGWGTALALLLTHKGHAVRLWVRRPQLCEQIQRERKNAPYLPDISLPESLQLTSSLDQAVTDAQLLVLAVPSHAIRSIVRELRSMMRGPSLIVSATKGIEEESLL